MNGDIALALQLGMDGVHLPAAAASVLTGRPLSRSLLFAVSCHSLSDIQNAARVDADFAVLGPVKHTSSHEDRRALGWDEFAAAVAEAPLPVFALGGLSSADLADAWRHRAQGIAGISAFWTR
jgi:8-oxo-dGTP diphosphatase